MIKKFLGLIALAIGVFLLARCTSHSGERTTQTPNTPPAVEAAPIELLGKTLFIDYGTMKAEVRYQADSLYWKSFTPEKVLTGEGQETPSYAELGDGRFLVTWQEADGTAVSQFIDLKENKVLANILAPLKSKEDTRKPLALAGAAAVISDSAAQPAHP